MSSHDISRYLFQPEKRYVGARMQQGRVITDEDLNAHRRLDAEDARRTVAEVICSKGTPNDGFRVGAIEVVNEDTGGYDFAISAGSFYLGGFRFEIGEDERLLTQSDYLQIDSAPGSLPVRPTGEGFQLVYLRTWEQCVAAVEDSEIIEHALGGPDTSVMVRRMRRVEVLQLPEDFDGGCGAAFEALTTSLVEDENGEEIATVDPESCELRSNVRLTVGFREEETEDPCQPGVSAGFIGAENQAIRVQLTAPNRFVWGYDNASPLYRVQVSDAEGEAAGERRNIRFLTLPRDQLSQPTTSHVVEILRWGALLPNMEKAAEQVLESHFTQVEAPFDPETGSLVIADAVPEEWVAWLADHSQFRSERDETDDAAYFYLRVWTGGGQSGTLFEPGGESVPLEGTGLTCAFSEPGRIGDYWIIAARPHTPDRVVPWNLLASAPPAGLRQFLAPLALIEWTRAADQSLSPAVRDCRHKFRPLCSATGCCTFTVGDGVSSHGVFNSIQQAIDHLPPEGGEICLLPGLHAGNVTIAGRRDITIHGCDKHTVVIPGPDARNLPVFTITDSTCIAIEDCTVVSLDGIAFRLGQSADDGELSEIRISGNRILAFEHGILVRGGRRIEIHENRIRILDREGGGEAILMLGEDSRIERNDIGVKPAPPEEEPEEPGTPEEPEPEDPCADHELLYADVFALLGKITPIFAYFVPGFLSLLPTVAPYRALGGIRVTAGSEGIRIVENEITGGAGNGITLGGAPPEAEEDTEEDVDFRVLHSSDRIYARLTGEGASMAGVSVRFTETGGPSRAVTAVSDSTGTLLRMAEPAEYRVAVISPDYRINAITTRDQGEFGVVHEIAIARFQAPPPRLRLGFLYDIAIEHNGISAMGLSGIGSPLGGDGQVSFVPRTNAAAAFRTRAASVPGGNPVLGARIIENTIRGCLLNPFDDNLRQFSQSRGFGGISLDLASAIEVAENTIEGNGRDHLDPVCGIFIGAGDQLEIHRNQVIDNGIVDTGLSLDPREGIRGGIVLGASLRLFPAALRLGFFRDYAARVHDNLVRHPVGHALLVAGIGPMSIDANRLHATRSAPGFLGELAGTVIVVNRGNGSRLASGGTTFHGNQVLGGPEIESLLNLVLVTGDDLGFDANQIAAEFRGPGSQFGGLTLTLLLNALLVGDTLRASDSRFKEPESRIGTNAGFLDIVVSLFSLTTTLNNTVSNQGDHCIFAASAAGSGRVRDDLNQVLDSQFCQTAGPAVGGPAQDYVWSRSNESALVENASMFSSAAVVSTNAESQVIAGRYSEAFHTLAAVDTGLASDLLNAEAEVRSLVQYESARIATLPARNDSRLSAFRTHLDARLETVDALAVDAEVAAVTVSRVEEAGMLIHGRVTDAAGKGIGRLLVCVIDVEGNPVGGIEPQTTDASGYYAFALNASTVQTLLESQPDGVHVSFFSSRGTPIFTTQKTTSPEAGKTEVINVRLDRDTLDVVDPFKPGPAPEPNLAVVPDVVGLNRGEAQARLREAGYGVGAIISEPNANAEPGSVLRQIPEAGSKAAPGLSIDLVIASGEELVTVPEIVGQTLAQARKTILDSQLRVGSIEPDDSSDTSIVVGQSPESGSQVVAATLLNIKTRPAAPRRATEIIARVARASGFESVGASEDKLVRLAAENSIGTTDELAALLRQEDRIVRDLFRLPNLAAARAFKRILSDALDR